MCKEQDNNELQHGGNTMSWENEAKREREIYLRRAIVQLLCKSRGLRKQEIATQVGCKGYETMFILHMLCEEGTLRFEIVEEDDDWVYRYYVKG